RRLLALLALLPDGIAHEDLDALLPEEAGEAAAVLRKVGLAFDQSTRLRALAPIREYVQWKHVPEAEDLDRTIDHYVELAGKGDLLGWQGGAEASSRLVQEIGNLDLMISKGLERTDPEPAILAARDLGTFNWFSGWGSRDLLEKAISVAHSSGRQQLEAECARKLGDIAFDRAEHYAAQARFEEALPLFRKVGDVLGEANCIQRLGEIALEQSNYPAAQPRFEEALALFRKIDVVVGEANCIHCLGDSAFRRLDYDTARSRFEEALPLFRKVGNVLGEANCIRGLGACRETATSSLDRGTLIVHGEDPI
ncbi:MAG: tetratricopeptide repeat protein, partial [Thermoanaerobaculia bacterium]